MSYLTVNEGMLLSSKKAYLMYNVYYFNLEESDCNLSKIKPSFRKAIFYSQLQKEVSSILMNVYCWQPSQMRCYWFPLFSVDLAKGKVFDGCALKRPVTGGLAGVYSRCYSLLSSLHAKRFIITLVKLRDYVKNRVNLWVFPCPSVNLLIKAEDVNSILNPQGSYASAGKTTKILDIRPLKV